MPSITALLHTFNHALQLGRALETLYPCDEILIVDHDSQDATQRIAREYGARIVQASSGSTPDRYWRLSSFDWILCLEPDESLTEALAASLYEWKSFPAPDPTAALGVFLREETAHGWVDLPTPQTRLVPKTWTRWQGILPSSAPFGPSLEGPLLRFSTRRE